MPKNINLTKVPHARKIENFWGCMAQKVYEVGRETKTEERLFAAFNLRLKNLFGKPFRVR